MGLSENRGRIKLDIDYCTYMDFKYWGVFESLVYLGLIETAYTIDLTMAKKNV